jgi:hypothetical protein
MDSKLDLLREFSRGFASGTAKVETERYGFAFLEELLADGARLEYGELTATRLLHKYKLVNLTAHRMDELLRRHLARECNLCRYFDAAANDLFCFNLDNNHKTDNTRVTPEMELAVGGLESCLRDLGCGSLIVASGRGYHVWGRLEAPVLNDRLYGFMLRAAARALLGFQDRGYDYREIKFNFYPDVRATNVVSLRLFGSEHVRNKVFSHVFTSGGLLGEADSWAAFEDFIRNRTISLPGFAAADSSLAARS